MALPWGSSTPRFSVTKTSAFISVCYLSVQYPFKDAVHVAQLRPQVEDTVDLLGREVLADGRVRADELAEVAVLVPHAHRERLHHRVGVLARDPFSRELEQHL